MLTLGGIAENVEAAAPLMDNALKDGLAWERFRELVIAQGGDVAYVDDPQLLSKAAFIESFPTPRSGYLEGIHAGEIGNAAVILGAGREKKGDPVDHAVGFEIHRKVGDFVERGEALFTIHANDQAKLAEARQRLFDAHTWSDSPIEPLPLFYGVIS